MQSFSKVTLIIFGLTFLLFLFNQHPPKQVCSLDFKLTCNVLVHKQTLKYIYRQQVISFVKLTFLFNKNLCLLGRTRMVAKTGIDRDNYVDFVTILRSYLCTIFLRSTLIPMYNISLRLFQSYAHNEILILQLLFISGLLAFSRLWLSASKGIPSATFITFN